MKRKAHVFDWDSSNTKKCQKHGVSISEIEFLFSKNPRTFYDVKHSDTETRYFAVGRNIKGRYLFVAFTYRTKNFIRYIRPFSSRYMHKKEIDNYKKYDKEK